MPAGDYAGCESHAAPLETQLSEIKGLFLDMFQHATPGKINLAGLEHVIVLTARGSKVAFRHYSIALKKSGERIPKVQLEEIGDDSSSVCLSFSLYLLQSIQGRLVAFFLLRNHPHTHGAFPR